MDFSSQIPDPSSSAGAAGIHRQEAQTLLSSLPIDLIQVLRQSFEECASLALQHRCQQEQSPPFIMPLVKQILQIEGVPSEDIKKLQTFTLEEWCGALADLENAKTGGQEVAPAADVSVRPPVAQEGKQQFGTVENVAQIFEMEGMDTEGLRQLLQETRLLREILEAWINAFPEEERAHRRDQVDAVLALIANERPF